MSKFALSELSEWARAIEERRRALGVFEHEISEAAGKSRHWWSLTKVRVLPPPNWAELEARIMDYLNQVEERRGKSDV